MLKRLKNIMNNNEVGKIFVKANVNQSQNLINFQLINSLKQNFRNEDKRQLIIAELLTGLKSKNWVQKLKYHIITHYYIVQTLDQKLVQLFMIKISHKIEKVKKNKFQEIKQWLNNNIIDYYHAYILKLCMNIDLFVMCTKITSIKLQDYQSLDLITNSFKALNMIHFIIETQINFNKLGRYYPQFRVVLDFFKMYLRDVKVFYHFLKLVIQFIFAEYEKFNQEQLKHTFSFINEVVKTSDRLYEFFYNRYYYYSMKQFPFPTFYKLDNKKYKRLVKYIKANNFNILIPQIAKNTRVQKPMYPNKTQMNLQTQQNNEFFQEVHKTYMECQMGNKFEEFAQILNTQQMEEK